MYKARLAVLGAQHPDTMRSRGSLANALHSAGQWRDAEELHRRNASDREAVLGIDHPGNASEREELWSGRWGDLDGDGDDGRECRAGCGVAWVDTRGLPLGLGQSWCP